LKRASINKSPLDDEESVKTLKKRVEEGTEANWEWGFSEGVEAEREAKKRFMLIGSVIRNT